MMPRRGTGTRVIGAAALLALVATPALAHPGRPPAPHDLWTAWSFEPGVLLLAGLSTALYARGATRLWRRAGAGRGIPRWRVHCFAAGMALLLFALVSPLDAMGSALFSAHMLQHEILMLLAAPLLVLGTPLIAMVWALPRPWRQRLARWTNRRGMRRAVGITTHMATVWLLYAAALWIWHLPPLYQATLTSETVHVLQHASFLVSALLFWWVLLHPARFRRHAHGAAVLYVFATAVHGSILGALLTFAPEPWYPAYAPWTRDWGLTPLDDQQLGGLIMWVPPGVIYLSAAVAAFGLWLRSMEARAIRVGRGAHSLPDADVASSRG